MCHVEESMLAVHVHIIDKQASIHLIIANTMLDSGGKKLFNMSEICKLSFGMYVILTPSPTYLLPLSYVPHSSWLSHSLPHCMHIGVILCEREIDTKLCIAKDLTMLSSKAWSLLR